MRVVAIGPIRIRLPDTLYDALYRLHEADPLTVVSEKFAVIVRPRGTGTPRLAGSRSQRVPARRDGGVGRPTRVNRWVRFDPITSMPCVPIGPVKSYVTVYGWVWGRPMSPDRQPVTSMPQKSGCWM